MTAGSSTDNTWLRSALGPALRYEALVVVGQRQALRWFVLATLMLYYRGLALGHSACNNEGEKTSPRTVENGQIRRRSECAADCNDILYGLSHPRRSSPASKSVETSNGGP